MSNLFFSFLRRCSIRRKVSEAYLVALLLILAAFPDVIFMGASFRLTDQITGAYTSVPLKPFYPVVNPTGWWAGYNDNGGAIYQSEPMIEFIAHSIKTKQTPYWNPYSAAGALGPESLVDLKFSAVTIANALMGGGSLVYNVIILILTYFAIFFLYRLFRELLHLSAIAAIGASIFYLLNGYAVANFGSNVTQSYLFLPMCLYVAIRFVQRPAVLNWVMVIFSFALFFSFTFMPTTITSVIVIGTLVAGCLIKEIQCDLMPARRAIGLVLALGAGLFVSLLLLSVLYLPVLENIGSLGTLDDYAKRIFWPLRFPQALTSLYTPSHFYESYNAMEHAAIDWDVKGSIIGNTVFHVGIIALGLAASAWPRKRQTYNCLIALCSFIILFVLIRLFDPAWLSLIFSHLPVIGTIGSQYWWPIIMIGLATLVAFGIENLYLKAARVSPVYLISVVGIGAFYYVFHIYGLRSPNIDFKLVSLLISLILLVIMVVSISLLNKVNSQKKRISILAFLLLAMFVELIADGKMIRFERNDLFTQIPPALKFVKDNIGDYRTLNFGQGGLYPELGSAFQIQEVTTLNQGVLPQYKDFFYRGINLENSQRLGYHPTVPLGSFPSLIQIKDKPSTNKFDWESVSFLGVKYLLLPVSFSSYINELSGLGFIKVYESPATVVLENKKVLPRAFTIDLPNDEVVEDITLSSDFKSSLLPSVINTYKQGKVVLSGTVSRQSLVVLSDNWHKNWTATLNDKAVSIVKVNGTFRGVMVPPGNYSIKMKYEPKTLRWAIGITSLVIVLLGVLVFNRKRIDRAFGHPDVAEA